jgi:hypothetical protein
MADDQPAAPGQPGFVRGKERLDRLLADRNSLPASLLSTSTRRRWTGSMR